MPPRVSQANRRRSESGSGRRRPGPSGAAGRQGGRDRARTHTTVSSSGPVLLRLDGIHRADADCIPWVNRLVDAVRDEVGSAPGGVPGIRRDGPRGRPTT